MNIPVTSTLSRSAFGGVYIYTYIFTKVVLCFIDHQNPTDYCCNSEHVMLGMSKRL